MGTILVVDDEQSMQELLSICLRRAGHEVARVRSADEAIIQLRDRAFDVVVTDLRMPGELDGLGLLKAIKSGAVRRATERGLTPSPIDPIVILMTAYASADTALAAMKQGAYDYLTKPFHVDDVTAVIDRALEKQALLAENLTLRDQVAGRVRLASLIGKSRAMQKLFEMIGKLHSSKSSVLIMGESGTGKELVARALHTEGARATRPFVPVNCAAIPEALMESELFGHKKGSFTGAVSDARGLFLQADSGTLFLDEIGELSLNVQVKLLRALQERKVKAVGATDEVDVDVRVIAASSRDLEAEVSRGAFRSDLYYRLNVIEVRIPPLRQRSEDIPLLVEHFVRKFSIEQGGKFRMTADAMARLESYDFPGNVRELENIIERTLALSSNSSIEVADLPILNTVRRIDLPAEFPKDGVDLDQLLGEYERAWVMRALEQANGVRKNAAAILGISFRSLRYRLQKLGIDKDEKDKDEKDEKDEDDLG